MAVLTVAATLLWTRVFGSSRPGSWGFWLGIGGGALAALLYVDWIHPNVSDAVSDVLVGLGFGSQLDPHPQRLLATLIDQVVALAVLSIVYVIGQVRAQSDPVLATGQGLGIGYGAYVLQLQLADAFAGGLTGELWLPAVAGALLLGIHMGAGMLLSLARLNGAYVARSLQAGGIVFVARYLSDLSDPGWEAGGLAGLLLVSLFIISGSTNRRDWGRR